MTPFLIILVVIIIFVIWAVLGVYPFGKTKPNDKGESNFNTTSNDNYLVSFKVSYPLSNGTYRETKEIDVVVTADSPQLAKDLAKKKALNKVQITVVNVEVKNQ